MLSLTQPGEEKNQKFDEESDAEEAVEEAE